MSTITPSIPQNNSSTPRANKPKLIHAKANLWELRKAAEKQKSYDDLYIKSREDWRIWEINANSQGS